jgi:hypothetical protein
MYVRCDPSGDHVSPWGGPPVRAPCAKISSTVRVFEPVWAEREYVTATRKNPVVSPERKRRKFKKGLSWNSRNDTSTEREDFARVYEAVYRSQRQPEIKTNAPG